MEYCLSITLLDRVFPIKHYDIRHILVYYCLCMLALIFRMIYGENWEKKIATARTYSVSVCLYVDVCACECSATKDPEYRHLFYHIKVYRF